jgi:hypothetical protein
MAITAMLVLGWRGGEPWTAAAFAVFFYSRIARSLIRRPLARPAPDDPARRANRFLGVTAAGWLATGVLAAVAALTGEGAEWWLVAPCFLIVGAIQLYVIFSD